jgi:hypothetical protein
MSSHEEKDRVSTEEHRNESSAPVLPTTTQDTQQSASSGLHPAFYVA